MGARYTVRMGRIKLPLRKFEVLLAIYWHEMQYGKCLVKDIVGELGISFITVADHLNKLKTLRLVEFSKTNAKNLGPNEEVMLTNTSKRYIEDSLGKGKVEIRNYIRFNEFLREVEKLVLNIKGKDIVSDSYIQPTIQYSANSLSGRWLEVLKNIFNANPIEPLITSITMFSDLDQLLPNIRKEKEKDYDKIVSVYTNLQIRLGRLASISIPVALKRQVFKTEMYSILVRSWIWPSEVSPSKIQRYVEEAASLNLITTSSDLLSTTYDTTTDILHWLAYKTKPIFFNTFSSYPKAALVLYREVYKLPCEDDVLNPRKSESLEWLQITYDILDKFHYARIIEDVLNKMSNIGLIEKVEGDRLVPYGYIRYIDEVPEIKEKFREMLNLIRDHKATGVIWLYIHSNPGIKLYKLYNDLKKKYDIMITYDEIKSLISEYIRKGILLAAGEGEGDDQMLYSFLHAPILSLSSKETSTTTSTIKTFYINALSALNSFTNEEKAYIYEILQKLKAGKKLSLEEISKDYGLKFTFKLQGFIIKYLEPFIKLSENIWVSKNKKFERLFDILSEYLLYEIVTGKDALEEFNNMISSTLISNIDKQKLIEEIRLLKESLIENSL